MPFETTPFLVLRNGMTMGSSPAFYVKDGDSWKATDWATYSGEVRTAGKALMQLGVDVGKPVTILGFNRPEWAIMDVGAMAVGAVPAGVYTTILNGYRMPSSYISLDINQLFFVEEFGYADIYFDGLGSVIDFFLSSRQL